jgi:stage III sporulation protein AF
VDFLKEWVRSLVLLVLLGGCLELLLPMSNMKKYVRMTMGLLVVLAVCKPLLALVGHPINLDAAAFSQQGQNHLPTVDEIMAQAGDFRNRNHTLVLAEARAKLAAETVQAAKAVKGVADAQATVELDEKGGEMAVRAVTVTLLPATGRHLVEPVKPVAPVKLNGEPEPPADAPAAPLTEAQRTLADAVRREVAARLGIRAESQMIRVLVNGGK